VKPALVIAAAAAGGGLLGAAYAGLVTGAVPADLGIGRLVRPLGPFGIDIRASREAVFSVLAAPYLGRQSRAMAEKIQVLDRGSDMVLAAHRTPIRGRWWRSPSRPSASPRPRGSTSGWSAGPSRR
jgi:hypothetical protein